jgi:hypothetical protein
MPLPHGKQSIWEKILEVFAPATRTATATSSEIDLTKYKGIVAVSIHSANGTGNADNTLTPSFTEASVSGGSFGAMATQPVWYKGSDLKTAFPAILGSGTNPGPIVAFIDCRDPKPFKKLVMTIAGSTPSFICAASIREFDEYPATGL